MKKQGKRMKIIETPALDPVTDESNFEYMREGKRVFTTQYFRDQREMLSAEQWESEFQQQPFEAKGVLFPEKSLNYFFELPVDRDPDSVIAVCDTADKGEDYCSMPIAAVYGDEVYIVDVVFDDAPPEVTKPECATALMRNKVVASTFESNNAGTYFARDVQQILNDKKYVCNIRTKRTISNKQTRIEFASDTILKNFYFKHPTTYARNSQYAEFMKQLITYTRSGKVPHDDAPDSLSLLENELRGLVGAKVEIMRRPV
jgi:predicted phage terminase large subunit-like protein